MLTTSALTPFRGGRTALSTLPVEVLLEIIQRLPISTVAALSALSKSWAAFVAANESSIYHSIPRRYGYAPESDTSSTVPPDGWKALCEFPLQNPLFGAQLRSFSHPQIPDRTPLDWETPRKSLRGRDRKNRGLVRSQG